MNGVIHSKMNEASASSAEGQGRWQNSDEGVGRCLRSCRAWGGAQKYPNNCFNNGY